MPRRPVSPTWVVASVGPCLIGYARTRQYRIDHTRLSGRSVVVGYDSWFHLAAGATTESVDFVMIFPGGTLPPCRAPRFDGTSGPSEQG